MGTPAVGGWHLGCRARPGLPPGSPEHRRPSGASRMTTHVELRSAYADSVTLLQVSRDVQSAPGVLAAQVAMATALNVEVLTGMGFDVPDEASPNDLVVALRVASEEDL